MTTRKKPGVRWAFKVKSDGENTIEIGRVRRRKDYDTATLVSVRVTAIDGSGNKRTLRGYLGFDDARALLKAFSQIVDEIEPPTGETA